MMASMLESAVELPAPNAQPNLMQFVMLPTVTDLLEERADAGDVQTCVALCELLQVVTAQQEVRLPDLDISLVREWYLSYIQLLQGMCLFGPAAYLIKMCRDPYIGAMSQQSTT